MQQHVNHSKPSRLKILPSGDPNTAFHHYSPSEVLDAYGHPRFLLSTSAKTKKCIVVRVLTRVLYLTPGVFCPFADSCLFSCLGHTSGRMHMADCYRSRDQRTALYLEYNELFIKRLHAEIALHEAEASRHGLIPAVRLNGTSDLPWERRHPDLFSQAADTQFFDYTKIPLRMKRFLRREWPANYHLTFSVGDANHEQVKQVLELGGTAAAVFWPELPSRWWGYPVLDGDEHDARFLDPQGTIVGLRAKGVARVDLAGFVIRPCPQCNEDGQELVLLATHDDTHRHTVHRCQRCSYLLRSRWILTPLRKKEPLAARRAAATQQSPLMLPEAI